MTIQYRKNNLDRICVAKDKGGYGTEPKSSKEQRHRTSRVWMSLGRNMEATLRGTPVVQVNNNRIIIECA